MYCSVLRQRWHVCQVMCRYLSSFVSKLLLCDFTTRFTLRYLLTFTEPTSHKKEIHLNVPQAKPFTVWPYIYKVCTKTFVLLRILYFYCMFQKIQTITGRLNPTPLFCCVVRQEQYWSQWRKHFVLFLKSPKLTSSEGGDVMSSEWLLFLSNFTILAWNLIS